MTKTPSTRRAFMGSAATVAALAVPAVAAATTGADPDARFLEWEKEHIYWDAKANERDHTDEELDALVDRIDYYGELIAQTPAVGLTGARVKAAFLLRHHGDSANQGEQCWHGRIEVAAMRSLSSVLNGTAPLDAASLPAASTTTDEPEITNEQAAFRYLAWLDCQRLNLAHELGMVSVHDGQSGITVPFDALAHADGLHSNPSRNARRVLRAAGVSLGADRRPVIIPRSA